MAEIVARTPMELKKVAMPLCHECGDPVMRVDFGWARECVCDYMPHECECPPNILTATMVCPKQHRTRVEPFEDSERIT